MMFEYEDDVFTNSPKLNFDDNNNNTNGSFKFNEEDSMLALATEECMKTGTFLPLLKEELKCKILAKCHEEGKQLNIKAEQRVAAPKKKLQPDEEKKLEKRREQNRRAAKKFRERKRSDTDRLEQATTELEVLNHELRDEIRRLSTEYHELHVLLTSHSCVVDNTPSVYGELGT
ncbi:uncharacterized protein LOC134692791 [Mytilus trossulus]|uniref:uncharacterized protein LOC134692791 n=1 Tax=Mytilus trossulus TaxID=6551 RepID=UPI0030077218